MAIETTPGTTEHPGGGAPAGAANGRAWWARPGMHTAIIGAVAGYAIGHWLGNVIASGYQQVGHADANDFEIVLGYLFLVLGWLIGLGVFTDPVRLMRGKRLADIENGNGGLAKYFRFTLDHKVVGLQYLVG